MLDPNVMTLGDLESLAEAALEPRAWAYYSGGAGDERTLRQNTDAWARRTLTWRVLGDMAPIDTSTTLLGTPVALPIGIAPTALHGLAHPDGEVATARAAARAGALYVFSTLATRPMEDVAAIDGPRWFQLYAHHDRGIAEDLVRRAVDCGFTAIVVTVDLPVFGRRERELRGGFAPGEPREYGCLAGYEGAAENLHVFRVTWRDLDWLRGLTDLPLVVKGVLAPEDAAAACEHGVDAVWVSNHGGRQLDRAPATVDVLEACADAVAGRAEVYVDGGIRRGTDVLAAAGLGARAVFAGRPWLYALAAGGEEGIEHVASILRAELETAMAVLGTPTLADVSRCVISP